MTLVETPVAPVRTAPAPSRDPWGAVAGHRDAWPTSDQDLLLRAALLPDERALDAWRELRGRLHAAELDGAAQAVLPILRQNLAALGVDDELMSLFKGVHRYTWARNQVLFNRMLPIVGSLERGGIPTLLLKGAAMVSEVQLDAGMRAMNDVDVLVPDDRRRDAVDVLMAEGLVPVGGAPAWYVTDYAPRFVPSYGFQDGFERQLDLHWHVLHFSCHAGADGEFWAAALPIERLGVHTRMLCPADQLLQVIVHGLRWNATPTYRWAVDAALLARGLAGAVDFDRIVEQARRHRVTAAVRAGFGYLRRVADPPVPEAALRALTSLRSSGVEGVEFRAHMTQPRHRGALGRAAIHHQLYVRRHHPVGRKPTVVGHVRLARRQLGIERLRDLRHALSGGAPGPGRPACETAAALGTGTPPVGSGGFAHTIDFEVAEALRRHVAYGAWLSEDGGCWLAGREARVTLGRDTRAAPPMVLKVWADAFLAQGRPRPRLAVLVGGRTVARLEMGSDRPSLLGEAVLMPASAVADEAALELVLRTPDAASPAQLGLDDDDRQISVFLRRLMICPAVRYAVGSELLLGEGTLDEPALAGGWGEAEPGGRWTIGPEARLLVCPDAPPAGLELEFDAHPVGGGRDLDESMVVDVVANGRTLASLAYRNRDPIRHCVPMTGVRLGDQGELMLGWRVRNPRSPRALGASSDGRQLGLFVRRVCLGPSARPHREPTP